MKADTLEFVFAIRFGGEVRELVGVKIVPKGDVYAFPPYARNPEAYARLFRKHDGYTKAIIPPVDVHMSKHRSGERHLTVRVDGKRHPTPETATKLQSTSNFLGVELLMPMPVFNGQFLDLPPIGTNRGEVVNLDADSAGFREGFFAVRVYLVEPNKEHDIPTPMNVGPRIVQIEKRVTPWVAVEVFQEKFPDEADRWSSPSGAA